MKILQRYIVREHIGPFVFSLAALTFLLLLNQIAKRFGDLVGKGLSWRVIGEFFALSMPFIIAMTLPMAVLVSTLYAFSRLAAENEITALRASGVGMLRIIRPVLFGAAVISLLMVAFNDQILPRTNHRLRTLQSDIARTKPTFALREQVINEVSPGRLFLRTGNIDEGSDRLREITIYDFSDPSRRRTIYADSGRMQLAANEQDLEMTLYSGYSQEIPRENTAEMQRLYYRVDRIRVRGVASGFERTKHDTYKSDREMSICEMQRQVSDGARELARARSELADAMANAAYRAATGAVRAPRPTDSVSMRLVSLGAAYCDYVLPFLRVKIAQAARVPAAVSAAGPVLALTRPAWAAASRPPAEAQAAGAARAPQDTARRPRRAPPARGAGAPGAGAGAAPKLPGSNPATWPFLTRAARASGRADTSRAAIAVPRPTPAGAANGARAGVTIGSSTPSVRFGNDISAVPAPSAAAIMAQLEAIRMRMTRSREDMSRYEVEIQKKFALAAACVVFVLMGAPIALRFPRGGVGMVIGVSLAVFGLYYVGLIAGESLADKLILSPFWAMWLANVLFTIIGIYFLVLVRKTGATTRGGDFREMLEAVGAWLGRLARLPIGRQQEA